MKIGTGVGAVAAATSPSHIAVIASGGAAGGSASIYGDDLALEVSDVPTQAMRINLIHANGITPDFEVDWGNGEVHAYADALSSNSTTAIFRNESPISNGAVVRIKSASKVLDRVFFSFSSYGQYVTACKQLGDLGYNTLQSMFKNCTNLETFEAGTTDTSNVTSTEDMFERLDNLISVDLTGMDFSSVTNANSMFYDCDALTSLTLTNADFSQCVDFESFMRGSQNVETIDISGTNFGGSASSTNFYQMFKDLRNLQSFNMSGTTFGPGSMSNFLYYAGYDYVNGVTFDFSNSNVDQVTNMYQFMYNCRYATGTIDLTSWNTSNVTNFNYTFNSVGSRWYDATPGSTYDVANSPTFIGLNTLQTGSATTVERMLTGTHDLNKDWDFSGWDISSCTNFYLAFYGTLVETLNLSNWTFATGTSLRQMFGGNPALNNLNISGWDTTGVTSMRGLFMDMGYTPITSYWATQGGLDVSHFDTSNVTDFGEMFNGLDVTDLNITGFDTSNATSMFRMFYLCNNLNSLDVSGFDTTNVTNFEKMFYDCDNLTTLDVSGFNTSNATTMREMFHDCENLITLDVSGFNTANVTDFYRMFRDCHDLTTIDVSNFDTSSVTGIGFREMFHSCRSVTTLDVSGFNTSGATSMQGMFAYNESLTSLNVSSFNTTNVTSMQDMFRQITSFTGTLDLSGFDTSSVTSMTYMFANAGSSSGSMVINTTGWDTSSVTDMTNMFYFADITGVTGIDAWNTSSLTNVSQMFYFANRFTSPIDISGWDVTNVTNEYNFANFATGLLDTTNYDALLIAWESDVAAVVGYSNGGAWNFGTVQYTTGSAADTARSNLINNHGWAITDGGGT